MRRMKAIDQALRAGKWPTDMSLGASLEVDPRTIRRDVEYMRGQHHATITLGHGPEQLPELPEIWYVYPAGTGSELMGRRAWKPILRTSKLR